MPLSRTPRSPARLATAAAVLLLAPLAPLAHAQSAAADTVEGRVTVTQTENSRWPSGYQAQITITNGTDAPLADWAIEFALPEGAKVHQMWNATLETDADGYTVTPPRWGATVPAGGSYTFGYNGAFSGGETAFTTCTVNGAPCDGGPGEPEEPEYRQVGYFTQWGAADRGYLVKDLAESGQAERLTHINYAFANLDEDGRCFITDEDGQGDAYADYGQTYGAADSVDGVADDPDQPLRGTFNQLRKLKEANPGLRVNIAIGGWAWSDHFSTAALPENREAAVKSCIDLYLRGDLPELNGAGGEGAAAGLFDGIDLDWEWPGTEGEPGNIIRPEDKENFTGLVQEFRDQLDELEREEGREFGLTAFVPANTGAIDAGYEVDKLVEEFDFLNVQGYDFSGAWDRTAGHQSNVRVPEGDPAATPRSYETVIQAYLDRGAEPEDLVMGVPFYGRGWTGVEPGPQGNGLWGAAQGGAPGVWEPGFNDYKVLKEFVGQDGFELYRDDHAGTAWLYNGTDFWNFDDPTAIAQKAAWVREKGLSGIMTWSLDGDDEQGSLVRAFDGELNGRG
ncbi:glycosyl hydrolase family 18 protein [Marinactinospora thermotolerans]|uniref:chitinase n=1 Tax=Marinactinospora thermotolerans DSM 45154 TaxID=1122192 RepID=A0A1T4Q7U4_9ACTN|nr:glycosyl hydrolase family 18 protein [Marinactinospora thermotolerans]SJZ99611.1 chitinase family 18 [Marinactinospora thermotolerans DSM 45154]